MFLFLVSVWSCVGLTPCLNTIVNQSLHQAPLIKTTNFAWAQWERTADYTDLEPGLMSATIVVDCNLSNHLGTMYFVIWIAEFCISLYEVRDLTSYHCRAGNKAEIPLRREEDSRDKIGEVERATERYAFVFWASSSSAKQTKTCSDYLDPTAFHF